MKRIGYRNKHKVRTAIITVIVMICALISIFPFYWMILNSVKDPDLINQGSTSIFTTKLTWESYKQAFAYGDGLIWTAYLNSLLIALLIDAQSFCRRCWQSSSTSTAMLRSSSSRSPDSFT